MSRSRWLVPVASVCLLASARPAGAAPAAPCQVKFLGDGFDFECLPGLTADRRALVVPAVDSDSARGNPNLTIGFVALAEGAGTTSIVIATPDEWDKWSEAERAMHIGPRLAKANAELVKGVTTLHKLPSAGQIAADMATFHLSASGYDFAAGDGNLTIKHGGKAVGSLRLPAMAKPARGCGGVNWPFVNGMWIEDAAAAPVLAVQVSYHGNDSCWEGAPQWRMVILGGSGGSAAPASAGADPVAAAAANDRGMKLYRAKDWAGAAEAFRAALAADPGHVRAHYNLACVASLAGDHNAAIAELRWLAKSQDTEAKDKLGKAQTDRDLAGVRDDLEVRKILGPAAPAPVVAPASTAGVSGEKLWTVETLGAIRIGMPAADLIKAIGKPEKKGSTELEAATGSFVSTWEYPAQGLQITMSGSSKSAKPTVGSILAGAACTLKTSRQIGIGSSHADVVKAYPKKLWEEGSDGVERIVVGSVYGGILFSFESQKVSEIFFGAAAE